LPKTSIVYPWKTDKEKRPRILGIVIIRAAGEIPFEIGGGRAALTAVAPGFAQTGSFSKIIPSLEREGLPFTLFDQVEPEPRLARVIQAPCG
jgi:alcohol dehydrogenase class IV